ncbi:MAG: hypothetical protein A2583_09430 [Bdellovibrionales bacterium RIFOXYD1_FULL_53_11]|nr:MAG: hypothetical protein A2583_09430 [Bdellovibrionales bacterium RIFOXYD1_FULL_53_11]
MKTGSRNTTRIIGQLATACLALALSAVLPGCESEEPTTDIIETGGETTAIVNAPANINYDPFAGINAVCDPFSGNPSQQGTDLDHGIVGKIYYLPANAPRYTSVGDYINNGTFVDATLFLDEINIATRKFDLGFFTEEGIQLVNQNGEKLYEYFALDLSSTIKLGTGDTAGRYQFGLLADDGAILELDTGSGFRTVVNDDGTHPTKFACASEAINIGSEARIPMRLSYYQGPRYHIALAVLWKKLSDNPDDSIPSDIACGKSGNNLFFDYNTVPSTPRQYYQDMLTRGWKPLAASNFQLPDSVSSNPCSKPTPTTILAGATPAGALTNQTTITFTLDSNMSGSTFVCSLDNAAATECTSPVAYSNLSSGEHVFMARAIYNGRMDPVGITYNWTVDNVAPTASAVTATTTSSSITITWTTNEPTTTALSWGPGTTTDIIVPEDTTFTTSHSITLTGLIPVTIYSYIVGGRDQAGNVLSSGRRSVRTSP